jgi:hypothetical protein
MVGRNNIRGKLGAIDTIVPDDGQRGLILYLKILPFSMLVPFFPILVLFFIDFPMGLLILMFVVVVAMYVFTYLFLTHLLGRRIQSIFVYPDGIQGYSSLYYSLRGLPGFIPTSRIEHLSIEPIHTLIRLSGRRPQTQSSTYLGQWYLTAKISGKGTRIICAGSPPRILQAAFKIERALGIKAERQGEAEELLGYLTRTPSAASLNSESVIDNVRTKGGHYWDFVTLGPIIIFASILTIFAHSPLVLIFWFLPLVMIVSVFYRERKLRPRQLHVGPTGVELIFLSGAKKFVSSGDICDVVVNWGDLSTWSGKAQQEGAMNIGKNYAIFLNREAALTLLRIIYSQPPTQN